MIESSFLLRLNLRLASGLQRLEPERAARHLDFILGFQRPDGGFSGRKGGSDLYYTSFAVRALALLQALDETRCEAIEGYLNAARNTGRATLIDLVSWIYSAATVGMATDSDLIAHELLASLETFRRRDGGYAKTPESGVGSTYNTFLAALCYEMLGKETPDAQEIKNFLLSRRRDDGGFVEIAQMKRSGTNPTAAAAVLLKRMGEMDDPLIQGVALFLDKVKGDEGGFRANSQIPISDLLSTFTALLTADELGILSRFDLGQCLRFVSRLERPDGGFQSAAWDEESDPEYAFYGLGATALLQASAA